MSEYVEKNERNKIVKCLNNWCLFVIPYWTCSQAMKQQYQVNNSKNYCV